MNFRLEDLNLKRARPEEIRESAIEKKSVKLAKSRGWHSYKFVSPGHRSVPDRIFMSSFGQIFFVEFKRYGQKPTPKQAHEIKTLRSLGFRVFICDSVDSFKAALIEVELEQC